MHLILLNDKKVLNMFYGDNDTTVTKWVKDYIQRDTNNDKDIMVEIMSDDSCDIYTVSKKVQKIHLGYFFNKKEETTEEVYQIKVLTFNETEFIQEISCENSLLWKDLNYTINNKVMKQLDQNSLYQVFMRLSTSIRTKLTWTTTELVELQNQILKEFKKDLYSSVAKKLKRFGKQNKPVTTKGITNCKLEYNIISKIHKLD